MRAVYLTALLIAAVTATPPLHKPSLSVSLNAKLQGAVSVNGAEWLQFAGGLGVHANGQYRACTAAKATSTTTPQGTDRLGKHTGSSFDFECAGARVTVAWRTYSASTTVLSFKVAGGNITTGSAGAGGAGEPVVGFPAFALNGGRLPELGPSTFCRTLFQIERTALHS